MRLKIFRGKGNDDQARDFRKNLSQDIEIAFLGVWDTVSAMLQKASFSKLPAFFEDTVLSDNVRYACQALAIDDFRRTAFRPILWGPVEHNSRMEQVWFAGAHSDVGGGYGPDNYNRRIARISLQWMVKRAQSHGLSIDATVNTNKISLPGDELGALHRPDTSLPWILLPFFNGVRNIPTYQVVRRTSTSIISRVHFTVDKRLKSCPDYRPINLPESYEVVDDDGNVMFVKK